MASASLRGPEWGRMPDLEERPLRLFLALWPAPALREALAARADGWTWTPAARRTPADKLHVTLHFLGDVAPARLPALRTGLAVDWTGCELVFDREAVWPGGIAVLEASEVRSLRARAAYDRANCVARRAEKAGDARALTIAESALHAELAREGAPIDPVSWAVAQLALARVYDARARLDGVSARLDGIAVALTEALDVFTELGLKTLAEEAQAALACLRGEEP